jgi:hypothetical protein
MHALSLVLFAALMFLTSEAVSAQTADRTIDEIKAETIARAQTGAYPRLVSSRAMPTPRSVASRPATPTNGPQPGAQSLMTTW